MDQARPISAQSSAAVLGSAPAVPDYELLQRIDAGAYGEVWLARSKATGALRAAKIVWRHTFKDERPFQREFEGIQKFERISREHPSQLALFHIGRNEAGGYFYYVMELADSLTEEPEPQGPTPKEVRSSKSESEVRSVEQYEAHTLRADLTRGRLPAARILEISLALAEALWHLHGHGLVHRDVKPSNVIFVNGRPKLADIGLVTDASDQCSIVGTEGYLPPEGPGTPQADIFALGKVIYEAATGLDRRRYPDLPADLKAWPDSQTVLELNQVVIRACSADVGTRYRTAQDVQKDLLQMNEGRSLLQMRRSMRRWQNVRRGATWLATATAVIGLLVLTGHALWGRNGNQANLTGTNQPPHALYTAGRTYLDKFEGAGDLQMAAASFLHSTETEPGYGPAYGCLAYTYSVWTLDGWNPMWKDLSKAKDYAREGLKLQDTAEAHLALAWYCVMREWRWQDAQREYETALALQPSSAFCHSSHAEFLRVIGHVDEALEELRKATNIQPHPKFLLHRLPAFLVDAKHYKDALKAVAEARASLSETRSLDIAERNALCGLGGDREALEWDRKFRVSAGQPAEQIERELEAMKKALDEEGPKADWQARTKTTRGYELACCYVQLGNTNEALRQLEMARDRKDVILTIHVMTDWRLDPLRSEPGFTNLLRTMNLPAFGR
jgi:serine/threonine protein kinase